MSCLRQLVIEHLDTIDKPCTAFDLARYVLGLEGTSKDVTRALMDLEREGLVRRRETHPITWEKITVATTAKL